MTALNSHLEGSQKQLECCIRWWNGFDRLDRDSSWADSDEYAQSANRLPAGENFSQWPRDKMQLGRMLAFPLILLLNPFEVESAKAKIGKSAPTPNLNSSYYKQPFSPCKLSRKMTAVGEMRAQAFATRVFARCGSSVIIKHAAKCAVPAYGESYTAHSCSVST